MDAQPSSRTKVLCGWIVFALAVALRLPSLLRPLYLDEFATLEIIRQDSFWAAMQLLRDDTHHPLYFAGLYGWAQLSTHTAWLRTFSLISDIGALWGLQWGLRARAQRAAMLGVALWGTLPVALRFSTEIRPYALLALTAIWAWATAQWVLTRTSWSWGRVITVALVWVCLVATHPVGILAVAAMGVALVLDVWATHGIAWRSMARLLRLLPACAAAAVSFVWLHWAFTHDPSGARISWMPKLSGALIARILNYTFGTDEGAPYALSGVTWSSNHAAGIVIFTGLLLVGWVGRGGRGWTLAAAFHFLIVCVVSVFSLPIFWYRSLVPAFILAVGAGALGLARLSRLGVGIALILVGWQTAIWLPRATRPVDPTEQAAISAVDHLGEGEGVYVFPDWMYITVQPFLDKTQWDHILPCGGSASAQHADPNGVAIVRCNLDLIDGPAGFGACLQRMRQRRIALHDLYVFLDDDDDMYQASRDKRQRLLSTVQDVYGPCDADSIDGRVVHLHCP